MNKSNIPKSILQEVLDSAPNAAEKGLSQFFTPTAFGRHLCGALPSHRPVVVDLNCGNGQLLDAAANPSTTFLIGADIDPAPLRIEASPNRYTTKTTYDLTLLYALLAEVDWTADLFVLNPPWRLFWHRSRLAGLADSNLLAVRKAFEGVEAGAPRGTIDSTIATLLMALDRCTTCGEGMLIANNATLERLVFAPGAPHAAVAHHIWARVIVPGNPMTGLNDCNWQDEQEFKTGVIYFAREHTNGPQTIEWTGPKGPLPDRCLRLGRSIKTRYEAEQETYPRWQIVRERAGELKGNKPRTPWNLWLDETCVIRTALSSFENHSRKLDKREAERLNSLNGQSPMQLVMQRARRDELMAVAQDKRWRVQPELVAAVQRAVAEYAAQRAPLYPLSDIQRLGYCDEQDWLLCKKDLMTTTDDKALIFRAGRKYPLRTCTVKVERMRCKPNPMTGAPEELLFDHQELGIFLYNQEWQPGWEDAVRDMEGAREYSFFDARVMSDKTAKLSEARSGGRATALPENKMDFSLQQLVEHFEIPEVPDVAACQPQAYAMALDRLKELEATLLRVGGDPEFSFRQFQREDLARGSLHSGLIASLDTGLGKSIYGYTWALLERGWTVVPATEHAPAQLQPNAAVLFIAPGDLHEQLINEGWNKLRVQTRVIETQEQFDALCAGPDGRPRSGPDGRPQLPAGFYISSFTQLATNNVARQQDPMDVDDPKALLRQWGLTEHSNDPEHLDHTDHWKKPDDFLSVTHLFTWRREVWRDEFDVLGVDRDGCLKDVNTARQDNLRDARQIPDPALRSLREQEIEKAHAVLSQLFTVRPRPAYAALTLSQQAFVTREFLRLKFNDYAENNGVTKAYPIGEPPTGYIPNRPETDTRPKWRVRCVYCPSLADRAWNAFDAILIDEAVKIKSTDSYVGMAVRSMEAEHRCVLTATPIKNRLPDIFWLAWWAAGGREDAHARFPYRNDSSEREEFARTFQVSERNLTKEEAACRAGKPYRGRFVKLTAEICNIHRLYKFLAPLVLRRRKDECGEEIMPKVRKVVRVQMGTMQKQVYRYHMEAEYLDRNDDPAIGAQLQALRTAAADPTSSCLVNKGEIVVEDDCTCKGGGRCNRCAGTRKIKTALPHRSAHVHTPKFAAVLSLIHEIIARNEQVLVGSVFNESQDHLGQLLREAGVPFILADGRVNPKKRGPLMQRFRLGEMPVALGGLESVANGHNLDTVNNVIIYAYSWAYDLIKQFLDRVHRLTSRKPINVYVVLCDGTIDRKLESLNYEKTDAVELALDGRLIGERTEEINLAELLKIARREFQAGADTVDETLLQREWPALRQRLMTAMETWMPDIPDAVKKQAAGTQLAVATRQVTPRVRTPAPARTYAPAPPDWRARMKQLVAALRAAPKPDTHGDIWDAM